MAQSEPSLGFWVGGYGRYTAALEAERDAELAELRRQLGEAEALDERQRLKAAIGGTKRLYRERLRRAAEHLY